MENMEKKEQQMKRDPRARINLENYLRMMFHPKGYQGFMEGVNYELELGPIQSSINKGLGTTLDVTKYVLYAVAIGAITYELFK
jgi:hypothetical protein